MYSVNVCIRCGHLEPIGRFRTRDEILEVYNFIELHFCDIHQLKIVCQGCRNKIGNIAAETLLENERKKDG